VDPACVIPGHKWYTLDEGWNANPCDDSSCQTRCARDGGAFASDYGPAWGPGLLLDCRAQPGGGSTDGSVAAGAMAGGADAGTQEVASSSAQPPPLRLTPPVSSTSKAAVEEPAAAEAGGIQPCVEEHTPCPISWWDAATGGFYCRANGGCREWTLDGGAFPEEVCPDQCSIGNTPTTSTTRTTTVTSTYPGMGISLLCWSLVQPGYELAILRRQHELTAGIFACNEALVLSFEKLNIGPKLDTVTCEKVECGISKDGTSANTLQFMKAWDVIKDDGRYLRSDWTVKADPDAVLLPDRLRIHLHPHQGANTYLRNCNKDGMSEGTMMFGSLEAISRMALQGYFSHFAVCEKQVPWQEWGEDLFMMRCLEKVGSSPAEDFSLVQDGVCRGVSCQDGVAAAFHPMKSVPAWEACWNDATAQR